VAAFLSGCVGHLDGIAEDRGGSLPANSGGAAGTGTSGSGGVVSQALPLPPELLHRLNRLEYNNTVRELLGTSLTPADTFPPDSNLNGFDNFAEGLSLSPALLSGRRPASASASPRFRSPTRL